MERKRIMNTITRRIDELGRIVLPTELRAKLALNVTDTVELAFENNSIVIRPGSPRCKLCFSKANVNPSLSVCHECIEKIKQL